MSINFTINGQPYTVNPTDYAVDQSLNTFIREHAQLPGTKFMCLEGGCGVCICVIKGRHPVTKENRIWATNSCLTLLNSCDGWDIITIEGIGNKKNGYHPVQERLAHLNGTQCGYCSPGMVMNMYALLEEKNGKLTMDEIENSFAGNLCRCTGYRPILDAMKSFATDFVNNDLCKNYDIEDLQLLTKKLCEKTKKPCTGICKINENDDLLKVYNFKNNSKWYTARTIKDIFDIFDKIDKNQKYMLVAGNTAHGVYRKPNDIEIFIDINNVQRLHKNKIDADKLEFGGNLNLTETMEILLKASKNQGFEYCQQVYNHFDLIANIPVRNMGTLAGNLCIKNQHEEFPSDVFISLEGLNAKITILTSLTENKVVSPMEFLKMDMTKCVMKSITLQKYDPKNYLYNSYKIMPRAQNAHAYVNASFLIQMDDKKENVINARLCFGGINPKFIHAENTEKFLQGKKLFDNTTIQKALTILNDELKPDWILPDASPEYRKILACGLFYKFILYYTPDNKINKKYKSGGTILKRDLSNGIQKFETNKNLYPITEAIPKIEALIQCSGEAFYMNDLPNQPKQLWCSFVHATQVNVKIANIDPSDALKIPGVVAFYSAKDIPGKNSFVNTTFITIVEDEEVFASDTIKYFAQPIGVIVAETSKIAQDAALKVKVLYEKLSENTIVMPTLQDIFKNQAWERCYDYNLKIPSNTTIFENQFVSGSKKLQGNFEIGSQYHFTMEPQTTVCVPTEDGINVYAASQYMHLTQKAISQFLNVKLNSIFLQVRRLGGGYGAKITRGNQISCACALACYKLNRTIRFIPTIESMMSSIGKRFACTNEYDIEIDDKGKILKFKNSIWEDAGCTLNESPVEFLSIHCSKNCYESTNWKIDAKAVRTDAPSHTWCRAPGAVEGIAMIENIMEHIAYETDLDPIDVRLINIPKSNKMYELLQQYKKTIDYETRKNDIEKFNNENRWRKKGLGIAIMQYPIEYFGYHTALVSIYHGDGTVSVNHGGIEMGQGMNTKVAQVVAHTLGLSLDMIRVHASDSFTGANSIVTGGGIGSESVCYATKKACEILLERIKPIRDTMKDAKWEDIIKQCWLNKILLTASDCHKAGDMKPYNVYGIACSEVEVDCLTGNLLIKRVDILEDTGESLSPLIDIGQIEGAFIMGIGYWLTEQLVFNRENGELLTTRTWNYKVPGAKDIPIDFRINLLQKNENSGGFMRSKATGEPPQCLAISALFAVRNAINSARKDANIKNKWYHLGAPTMPEHILLACGNSLNDFNIS